MSCTCCCQLEDPPALPKLERPVDPMEDEEVNAQITGIACARAMAAAALRAQSRLQEIHVEEVLPHRTSRNATVEFQRMVAQQDFLRTLVLQKDVCRGISLRTALRVSEHKAREAWESSRSVGAFDVFISHSWKSEKRLRHGSLLLQSGWMEMVIAWSIAAILSFFLSIFDLLPLFWSYEAEAFQEEYQCFLGCWILAFSMLAAMLALLASPYLPEIDQKRCFLDVASLCPQGDLRQRGLESFAGFLLISEQLRVWYTPEVSKSLWCLFEVALYRKIHPESPLVFAPLSVECLLLLWIFVAFASSLVFAVALAAGQSVLFAAVASSVPTLPLLYPIHLLRKDLRHMKALPSELKDFDLEKVECGDREVLYAMMAEWFGGVDAFLNFAQDSLGTDLKSNLSSIQVSAFYYFFTMMPVISVSLDFLVGFVKAGMPNQWQVSYIVAVPLGFGLWVSMATALLLKLCHFFSGDDILKTLVIFFAWVIFQVFGLISGIACHMSTVWAVLVWSISSLFLFRLLLWWNKVG